MMCQTAPAAMARINAAAQRRIGLQLAGGGRLGCRSSPGMLARFPNNSAAARAGAAELN